MLQTPNCATNVRRTGAATKLQHLQKTKNKCGNLIAGTNGTFGKCCSGSAAHTWLQKVGRQTALLAEKASDISAGC
jgi:hypothetical protein